MKTVNTQIQEVEAKEYKRIPEERFNKIITNMKKNVGVMVVVSLAGAKLLKLATN